MSDLRLDRSGLMIEHLRNQYHHAGGERRKKIAEEIREWRQRARAALAAHAIGRKRVGVHDLQSER